MIRTVIALVAALAIASTASAQLRPRTVASGFITPVAVLADPADRSVLFVVQQNGHIRVIRAGAVLSADFLDLSGTILGGGERGLLGLAFAPDYTTSGRFFV